MMSSDHPIESEPQHESGLHHRETVNNARGDSADGLRRHPNTNDHGGNGSIASSENAPRKRHSRDGASPRGNVRIDVDDKYVKYTRRRRRKRSNVVALGAVACVASFALGFAWMHYFARDEEPRRTMPRTGRSAASTTGTEGQRRSRENAPAQHRKPHGDKRDGAPPNPDARKKQSNVNEHSLRIPRFDARKFVASWERRAKDAALRQIAGGDFAHSPQSIGLETWNFPVAFRDFPYARQTHGPVKNLDSDYGGLAYHSVKNEPTFARVIPADDPKENDEEEDEEEEGESGIVPGAFDPDSIYADESLFTRNNRRKRTKGSHPAYDSFGNKLLGGANYRETRNFFDDDTVHVLPKANDGKTKTPRACQKTEFSALYFPNCNAFHEHDLGRAYDDPALIERPRPENEMKRTYLAHGYYRDVWIVEDDPWTWPGRYPKERERTADTRGVEKPEKTNEMVAKAYRSAALKTLQMKHPYTLEHFDEVRNEAVIMERLTGSPRIMNVYGHCTFSTLAEVVPVEFEEAMVPGEGYYAREEIEKRNKDGVRPFNDFAPAEKLGYALEMAASLADLHGHPDGVVVHDDVQPCQWLRDIDGRLKLGDFNRATVMQWDLRGEEYCKFNNGEAFANYRAPEEFAARNLDEQIDVFSFGNNLYGMLTGLWNFYDTDDDDLVQTKLIDGKLPYVDPRYKERSFAERSLVELMEKCWIYDPDERISIFGVVDFLEKAVEKNSMLEAASKR